MSDHSTETALLRVNKSYFRDRSQRVQIDGIMSATNYVYCFHLTFYRNVINCVVIITISPITDMRNMRFGSVLLLSTHTSLYFGSVST